MLVAMRSPPSLTVLARRAALLFVVACFAVACAPSVAPMSAPSAVTAAPASSTGDTPATRASGTVKIHDGNSESEGPANDPKVCAFHLHFFFGAGTAGTWRIEAHPGGSQVMNGPWASGEADDVRVPPDPELFSLPDGQYKLDWTQDGENGAKQKVFKVECAPATTGPTAAPTAAPEASQTPTPTASPTSLPSPTATPTAEPTHKPDATIGPTEAPTATPTAAPTRSPSPTPKPTAVPAPTPTPRPTASPAPTPKPTFTPAPSGDVGSETGGTNTPAPDGGTAADTATEPALVSSDADEGSWEAFVWLLAAGLAGFFIAHRRFAAGH